MQVEHVVEKIIDRPVPVEKIVEKPVAVPYVVEKPVHIPYQVLIFSIEYKIFFLHILLPSNPNEIDLGRCTNSCSIPCANRSALDRSVSGTCAVCAETNASATSAPEATFYHKNNKVRKRSWILRLEAQSSKVY